ncbi:MAG: hypothetical protein V1821_03085 [bacterium]
MTSETKSCQVCKQSFTIEPEDFHFYEQIKVPPPTWCPDCRRMRRLAWRNERTLYPRKCDLCAASILTIYSPDKPRTVYCRECWYSDKWNPLDYGQDYDFSKNFFEQFSDLMNRIPYLNLSVTNAENSAYTNYSLNLKNCYLVFGSWECEDCLYSQRIVKTKDVVDSMWLNDCELAYETAYASKCFEIKDSFDCESCSDVAFLEHASSCSDCFASVNLRNKSNFVFNQCLSKEDYKRALSEFDLGSYKSLMALKAKFKEHALKFPHPATTGKENVNSTGDLIKNCKNCMNVFVSNEGEDSANCCLIEKNFKNCQDLWIAMENTELCYEVVAAGANNFGSKFGLTLYQGCSDLEYCYTCISSHDSFGSASLKNNKYCILNKQYSKGEYEVLVEKIRKQMSEQKYRDVLGREYGYGEFFPPELSPFAYNESLAQQYFPSTKEQAGSSGLMWKELAEKNYQITLKAEDLPDHIKDAGDDILKQTIGCLHAGKCNEQCTLGFKIIPAELAFYRKKNIALPRLCFNCRQYERLAARNPFKLWKRKCNCAGSGSDNAIYKNQNSHPHGAGRCQNQFQTSFAPDRPEIIYCEECYQQEIS